LTQYKHSSGTVGCQNNACLQVLYINVVSTIAQKKKLRKSEIN